MKNQPIQSDYLAGEPACVITTRVAEVPELSPVSAAPAVRKFRRDSAKDGKESGKTSTPCDKRKRHEEANGLAKAPFAGLFEGTLDF